MSACLGLRAPGTHGEIYFQVNMHRIKQVRTRARDPSQVPEIDVTVTARAEHQLNPTVGGGRGGSVLTNEFRSPAQDCDPKFAS